MADQEHLNILSQGIREWNKWRRQHPEVQPDLCHIDLSGASLHGASLHGAELHDTNLSEVDLSRANLRGANLCDADLSKSYLSCTDLSGAFLICANLHRADLSDADLSGANLSGADLTEADLSGAGLTEADLSGADLNVAELYKTELIHTDLSGANLSSANLSEAYIRADLSGAILRYADLSYADLSETYLAEADLSEADLSGANLSRVYLYKTDLSEANLSKAIMSGTILSQIDLHATKGLIEIQHNGPSRMELYTVKLPQDGSALHFLRGIGIPNEWIDLYRIQMSLPIQYHSLFISYSSKDEMFARRLHADLQDRGVRCWFASEDLKIGDKIRTRIDEAIHLQDKLLLLLSEHALASTWVEDEVEAALEKERRQQREVLFPVRLDESVMQTRSAWAATLRRTRHIGDFTRWMDPQAYQQAFERLLRDLKAENETSGRNGR